MKKCMPVAYNIHGIGELIGFIGLMTLLGTVAYIIFGHFQAWWLLAIPFGMGIVSEIMVQVSRRMVARSGFEYDYGKRESSWVNGGQRVYFKYGRQDDVKGRHGSTLGP